MRWQGIPSAWSQRPPEQRGPRTNGLAFTTKEDPEGPQGPHPHSEAGPSTPTLSVVGYPDLEPTPGAAGVARDFTSTGAKEL